MTAFAERLNSLMIENNVTRYRLAKDLGVSKQTVTFWCDGINEPKISYLLQIAEYFMVSADYLLGMENYDGSK